MKLKFGWAGAVHAMAFCAHYNKYVCFNKCRNTHGDKAKYSKL